MVLMKLLYTQKSIETEKEGMNLVSVKQIFAAGGVVDVGWKPA